MVLIVLGKQNRLYIQDLSIQLYWEEIIQLNLLKENNMTDITIRELVRAIFAQLGVEIEFCGRGSLEKGVIIDIDEERLDLLYIDKEYIKFGQTVVKIEDQSSVSFEEKRSGENHLPEQNISHFKTDFDFEMIIKNMIMRDLEFMRKES